MVNRKGASTIIAVFVIMVISLIAVSWFRANVTSGTGAQERIIRQSGVDTFTHRFENTKLYLENSLMYAGQKGSDTAANLSGRKSRKQQARYWYCAGSKQIPSPTEVRNATSNTTLEYMKERFEELHGIRDNTVYKIGEASCVDTGYNKLPAGKDSDNFTQAIEISSINLTRQSGGLKMSKKDVTLAKEIKYNRMWYIYSTLRKWINQEDLKNEISTHLGNVEDSQSRVKEMCISKAEECEFKPPYMCGQHPKWFSQAVNEGLDDEMERLESSSEYFNETGIECSFSMNRKNNMKYPGHLIVPKVNRIADKGNNCACDDWDEDEDECLDYDQNYDCITSWHLKVDSTVDFTLSCRDKNLRSVPNSTMKNLNWKIDLSYRVGDASSDGSFSCSNPVKPSGKLPTSPRRCTYTGSASTCSTGVDTTG